MTGKTPPELVGLPELPEAAAHVWGWFIDLSGKRTLGGMGVNPITWTDIDAWSRLTGTRPLRWELDALAGIDGAYLASIAPESKE